MAFDYIVVGGGSAGCVAASHLSDDPSKRVLLIEAGGSHHVPWVQVPFFTVLTMPYRLKNWYFYTEPQAGLMNRCGYQPRGKVLGGSSAINAMIYIRGQAEDYDNWAHVSSPDWSYESLLPLFNRLENNQRIKDAFHGQEGALWVSDLASPNPASRAFVEAAKSLNYPVNDDFNGASQLGVGLYQVTQKNGSRHTAAHAFLDPVKDRPNLTVWSHARALKLLLSGTHCTGVQVKYKGKIQDILAKEKVILCAGAIQSPQLLLLSGIGPAEELARHDIACVRELPGVGSNLHDHPDYIHNYYSSNPELLGFTPSALWRLLKDSWRYWKEGKGAFTSNFAEAGGFLSTDERVTRPDIQLHFVPGLIDDHCHKFHVSRGMSLHVCILRPTSRGHIRLKSADPFQAPAIDPAFLSTEHDVNLMLKGFKQSREIMEQEALSPYRGQPLYDAKTDEEIIKLLRMRTDTVYHPVGSCRMGTDEMAVVDPKLHVQGVSGLMVADASIMPEIVSGNTNAPCMVIGARAAEFARGV